MKRIITTLLLGLLTLVLLIVAGLGILLATFDPNDYKDRIAAVVHRQTGLTIVFDGDLKTTILPVIGISTGKLRVLDDAVFGQEPFIEVAESTMSLSVMPLLRGRVEVQDILLDGMLLKLVTTSTGQNNWEALLGSTAASSTGSGVPLEAPQPASSSRQPGSDMSFTAESIRVTNAQVLYRHLGTKEEKKLDITILQLQNLGPERKMPMQIQGSFADSAAAMHVTLSVQGNAIAREIAALDARELSKAKLELNINQMSLDLQHGKKPPLILTAAFNMAVELDAPSVVVTDLKGNIQKDTFTAELALGLKEEQIALKGKFVADSLDVDALVASLPEGTSPGQAVETSSSKPVGVVAKAGHENPLLPLAKAEGSFEWQIGRMLAKGLTLANVQGNISLAEGLLKQNSQLEVFSGQVETTFSGSTSTKTLQGTLDAQATGLRMEQILQVATGQQKMTGVLGASCNLKFQGNNWQAIAPTLSGSGNFRLVNGEVRQIRLLVDPIPGVAPLADTFVVESLAATTTITNGIARSNDIRLQSPALQAEGNMALDIPRSIVDANLTLRVGGNPPAIPFIVRGPLNNLSYRVDVEAMARGAVDRALRSPEELERTIQKIPRETDRLRRDLGRVLDRL